MCDPLSIAGAALSGVGTIAQMAGQQQQNHARQRVLNAERARQAEFERQSSQTFNHSLGEAGAPQDAERRAAAEAERTTENNAAVQGARPIQPPEGNAPQEVRDANDRALRGALSRGMQRASRYAHFGAYGDSQTGLNSTLARDAQWQSIFGGNAVRSAQIVPGELERANYAGSGLMGLGSLLSIGGRATGAYGASGNGPTWDGLFGRSPTYATSLGSP